MTATSTPIEIVQGATYNMQVTWTDNSQSPQPKSLAGYDAHMQIRLKPGAPGNPIINLSSKVSTDTEGNTVDPAITLEPDNQIGVVDVRISAQLTRLLKKSSYYDLFLISTSDPSESVRLIAGTVTVDLSVTVN
jgi:hypothetical protein